MCTRRGMSTQLTIFRLTLLVNKNECFSYNDNGIKEGCDVQISTKAQTIFFLAIQQTQNK